MSTVARARAIALFNPAAPKQGFLQPVFAGPPGDNKVFVQSMSRLNVIDGFLPVDWPERDCERFDNGPFADVGGESVWGFVFGSSAPLVLPWTHFRTEMSKLLSSPLLSESPLLAFDVVDTLDLKPLKTEVFTRAYQQYLSFSREAADNWRDRAILEPVLAAAIKGVKGGLPSSDERVAFFRARIREGQVLIGFDKTGGTLDRALNNAYRALQRNFPMIFPRGAKVSVQPRGSRKVTGPVPARIIVVLVGRIRHEKMQPNRSMTMDARIVDADHFAPDPGAGREPELIIVLGAQGDATEVANVGRRMGTRQTILVILSMAAPSLIRQQELERKTNLPTITFFAPFATGSSGRDPAQQIALLVDLLGAELKRSPGKLPLIANHCLLMREPVRAKQTQTEAAFRLAARALRAGALLDGSAQLYCHDFRLPTGCEEYSALLDPLFRRTHPITQLRPVGRRPTVLLLVERVENAWPSQLSRQFVEGARRLFEVRGWRILNRHDNVFEITDGQRQFGVTILDADQPPPRKARPRRHPASAERRYWWCTAR